MESRKFFGYSKKKPLKKQDVEKIRQEGKESITIKTFIYVWFRSWVLQSSFNYSSYQGAGYAYAMFPILQKIYADNVEGLKTSLTKNSLFYNTNPQLVPLIFSIHATMLMSGKSEDEAISMKMALMGPLSGIGDSLSQFCLAPIFAAIGSQMALDGSIVGPIFFIVGINSVIIVLKVVTGYVGYKMGTKYISQLSNQMKVILNGAMMVGVTIITALAISFTKVNVNITATQPGEEVPYFDLALMANSILPSFFTLITLFSVYGLIKKANWTVYKIIFALMITGVVGAATGILV